MQHMCRACSYVSLAGATLTAASTEIDFSYASVLCAMRRQYPHLAITDATLLDSLLSDERGFRCPICNDRRVVQQCARKADALVQHIAQEVCRVCGQR